MSSDRAHSPTSTSPPSQRRLSLNPGALGDFFSKPNNSNNMSNSSGNSSGNSSFPNPITTAAAANAQSGRRRMSITTLGLSGSPTQPSPFGAYAGRRESLSSSESYEDAIEDTEHSPSNNPASPLARRVSFGAQALRDVRGGSGSGNGRYPSSGSSPLATRRQTASSTSSSYSRDNPSSLSSSSSAAAAGTSTQKLKNERSDQSWRPLGEGFNWSAALRTRAERAPSIGGSYPASSHLQPSMMGPNDPNAHQRSASIAIMEQPTRDIPRESRQSKPDFFQEKILRADFMD